MGLNIIVYRGDNLRVEHEKWDTIRYAGDRDFVAMLGKELPCIERKVGPEPDFEWCSRPADFAEWRKVIASKTWPNPGRFEGLTDLLESEPDCWLCVSW